MTLLKVKTSRATSLLVVSHQSLDKIQTPSCDPIFLTDWLLLNFVVLSSQLHHTPRHFLCLSHTYFFSFVSTVFLLHPSLPCLSKKKKKSGSFGSRRVHTNTFCSQPPDFQISGSGTPNPQGHPQTGGILKQRVKLTLPLTCKMTLAQVTALL